MKELRHILKGIEYKCIAGDEMVSVNKLSFNSTIIEENDLFFAVKGTRFDGHQFIPQAIEKGAKVIVFNDDQGKIIPGITYIKVPDTATALAEMAAHFYGHPTKKLKLFGVTGTNGKTSTVTILYDLFRHAGYKAGLISTIRILINDREIQTSHTTPDSITLNKCFREMLDAGCTHAFMEVSSHAISQKRTHALHFTGAVFTNISRDHLDYHPTFKDYIDTKKYLFDNLPASAFALVNADDKHAGYLLQNTKARKITYSLKNASDNKIKILEHDLKGMLLKIEDQEFYTRRPGIFNAYNLLAVYAVARENAMSITEILRYLSMAKNVDGRFDLVHNQRDILAVVDYAHSPDALDNVLKTIVDMKKKNSRVLCIFGCGGDRDKGKRPQMGRIAASYADLLFITSDNPRSENPDTIIEDILQGVPEEDRAKLICIPDREQAIMSCVNMSQKGDIILLAGKGHEKYQEIQGVKYPFDDKKILDKYLNKM
jgi:UDP-N-acetylmuramoyl-L-alanyl-D-glutamate--2,6-diaminopimelate ligase